MDTFAKENIYDELISPDVAEFCRFYDKIKMEVPEPYLVLLKPSSKDPISGISWKKNKVSLSKAINHMKNGGNIGIAGTDHDRLVLVDKDDIDIIGDSKKTFVVVSRKRNGEHHYYYTNEPVAENIFYDSAKQNMATEHAGEVRAVWQYVVAPGSYVPVTDKEYNCIPDDDKHNAGKYSIKYANEMSEITFEDIPSAYTDNLRLKRMKEVDAMVKKAETPVAQPRIYGRQSALYDITMKDVAPYHKRDGKRFKSFLHGSSTEKNTSYMKNGELFSCWRHSVIHTRVTALAALAGIGGCYELGIGHNGMGVSALDMKDGKTIYRMWIYAKENAIIPRDDPIPAVALVWYGVENDICIEDDIQDGWKIPYPQYRKIIKQMTLDMIDHGRSVKIGG